MLLGIVTIPVLPVAAMLRAAGVCGWCIAVAVELHGIASAYRRCSGIRITSTGHCEVRDRDGDWQGARLTSASVVWPRLAWLSLQRPGGCRHFELVRGNARESKQWRRLQVIWRHLGTAR